MKKKVGPKLYPKILVEWTCGELWKCDVEKYEGVNRVEGVETRLSASVILAF